MPVAIIAIFSHFLGTKITNDHFLILQAFAARPLSTKVTLIQLIESNVEQLFTTDIAFSSRNDWRTP